MVETEKEKSELKKRKRNENEKAPFYIILFKKKRPCTKGSTHCPTLDVIFLDVGVMFKGRQYCDVSKKLASSLRERRGLKHAVVLLSET